MGEIRERPTENPKWEKMKINVFFTVATGSQVKEILEYTHYDLSKVTTPVKVDQLEKFLTDTGYNEDKKTLPGQRVSRRL